MPSRERPGIGPSGWREAPWFIVSLVFQLWAAPCILGLAVVTSDEMPIVLRTVERLFEFGDGYNFVSLGFSLAANKLPTRPRSTPSQVHGTRSNCKPRSHGGLSVLCRARRLLDGRQPTRTKHSRPVAQLPWMSPGRPRWNRDTRALFNALLCTPYNRQSCFSKVTRSRLGVENGSSDIKINLSTSNQHLPLCPRQLSLSQPHRAAE